MRLYWCACTSNPPPLTYLLQRGFFEDSILYVIVRALPLAVAAGDLPGSTQLEIMAMYFVLFRFLELHLKLFVNLHTAESTPASSSTTWPSLQHAMYAVVFSIILIPQFSSSFLVDVTTSIVTATGSSTGRVYSESIASSIDSPTLYSIASSNTFSALSSVRRSSSKFCI